MFENSYQKMFTIFLFFMVYFNIKIYKIFVVGCFVCFCFSVESAFFSLDASYFL